MDIAAYENQDYTGKLALYLHIPFCVRKCLYCDFLSGPAAPEERARYVSALKEEIAERSEQIRYGSLTETGGRSAFCAHGAAGEAAEQRAPLRKPDTDTIYFGGGTPSLLTLRQVDELLETIYSNFAVEPGAEISMECNPGTVSEEWMAGVRSLGVNRLSLGVQSFRNEELRTLGRIHTAEEAVEAVRMARKAGFDNLNLDLMSDIPGQTMSSWKDTLRQAVILTPEHISAYSLIIEEGTPFWKLYGDGRRTEASHAEAKDPEGRNPGSAGNTCGTTDSGQEPCRTREQSLPLIPDEETDREMYHFTGRFLSDCGIYRYEISSYARPGRECRHNIGYWKRHAYLGFGIGAASLVNETRFTGTRDFQVYCSNPGGTLSEGPERLTERDRMEEFLFLGLRMTDGVSARLFERTFGRTLEDVYGDVIRRNAERGLLLRSRDRICLSERGLDLSNEVMADFLF